MANDLFTDSPAVNAILMCAAQKPSHWIEILLEDENGLPVPGEEYTVTLPSGETMRGYVDDMGFARVAPLEEGGVCQVSFPRIHAAAWKYVRSEGSAGS